MIALIAYSLFAFLPPPASAAATKPIGELKSRTTIREHLAPVRALEFSRDGKLLASADAQGVIVFFNGVSGKKIRHVEAPKGAGVLTISFSPDGASLASAHSDNAIRVWDVGSGELKRQIAVQSVTAARFFADGKALVATRGMIPEDSDDVDHVLLVDAATGTRTGKIETDFEYVVDATVTADGATVAISGGESLTEIPADKGGKQRCHIELWNLKEEPKKVGAIGQNSPQPLVAPMFTNTANRIAASAGDWLVWEVETATQLATLRAPEFKARCCAFSPSGRWIATGAIDSTVAIFNTRNWELAYQSQADPSLDVHAIAFSPSGSILAAARGRLVELFASPAR